MNALLALATLFALSSSGWAEGTKFSVKTTDANNTIQFISDAPLEKIVGKTSEVLGEITLDPANLKAGATGTIRVPLGKLDTGLSLRNEHMRANHLETKKYPEVVFTIQGITSADPENIAGGGTASTLVRGELELHGVKKEYEILGQLSYDPATGSLSAHYHWPISLEDHQIVRPDFLFMKLSDTQEITVDIDFQQIREVAMAKGHGEILIVTTIDHADKAESFSRGLVEKQLAACVTRLPNASSMYRWEFSEVTDNPEIVLLIKSHHSRLDEIKRYFGEAHPYTVPEFLVFEVAEIGDAYRTWLMKEIGL